MIRSNDAGILAAVEVSHTVSFGYIAYTSIRSVSYGSNKSCCISPPALRRSVPEPLDSYSMALDHSSLRRFEACPYGRPPSTPLQLRRSPHGHARGTLLQSVFIFFSRACTSIGHDELSLYRDPFRRGYVGEHVSGFMFCKPLSM